MASSSSSSNPKPQRPKKFLNPNAPPFLPENKKNMINETRAMGPTPVRVRRPIKKKLDRHHHHNVVATGLGNVKWVPKNEVNKNKNTVAAASSSDLKNGGLIDGATTTVMVKNIPNQFRRTSFLRILTSHCGEQNIKAKLESDPNQSEFDFVYLPMDFNKYWCENKIKNLGYAFVNFTTAAAAQKFYQHFHNRPWNVSYNRKTCEITCAKIQGKAALIGNFKHKIFWCHSKGYMPVVVSPPCDGTVVPSAIPPGRHNTMVPRATAVGILGGAPSCKPQPRVRV